MISATQADAPTADAALETRASRRRADASRNHQRILAAARDVFVEQGADAPLDEIARRAGVGNATLYRHFDDREDLIRQVAMHVVGQLADDAEAALDEKEDPFQALRFLLHTAADRRIGAVIPAVKGHFAKNEAFYAVRRRAVTAVEEIMRRARESGQLRPDVGVGDIWVALAQITRPLPGARCSVFEGHVGRHLEIFLAGMRAPTPTELPGSPFHSADLERSCSCVPPDQH